MQPEPPLPKGCAATAYRRSKSNRACSGGHVRPWPELLRTVQLRQHFLFVSSNFLFVSSGGKAQGGFVSCIFLTRCGFCPPRVRYLKKSQFSYPQIPPLKAASWANTHNAAGSREPGVLVPPSQHAGPSVSKQHKRQREAAHSRSHSAHEEGKERARWRRSDSAGGRHRKAPYSWQVPGYPSWTLRPGTYDQIKIATRPTGKKNCESDTRIDPWRDLDGRPALVVFRGRSRASSPASNEP